MRTWAIALALAGAALTGVAAAEEAPMLTAETAAALGPNRFVWADAGDLEPVSVVVSVADQRAYVYRGQTLVAVSTVSTGTDDRPTPAGTYPILQKKVAHRSNLYDDASMPFMQRLTWDGIALHAGSNPGFPASHGCVRLPAAFAKKLFAVTAVGTTVTVMDEPFLPDDGWIAPAPEPDEETAKANLQIALLDGR